MPLKPIFDKAPLTAMNAQPLRAGLVRAENVAMNKLYTMTSNSKAPAALEGTFRLACIVTAKPADEPVAAKIRALLNTQNEEGSFALSMAESVAVLRAAWALYEYEARKPLLDHIARWCAYAVKNWEMLMADNEIWTNCADLLELLENLYRVTGKAAVLTLCDRIATQTMGWSSVLNTMSSQRPTNKAVTREEMLTGIEREAGSREGYYTHFRMINHPESLADGARSTMAKGWYSGSATELNAARNGWERLYRYHGAICGGLTSDELLEGTAPSVAISTAALGAWAEALCSAAMGENAGWAYDALGRMAYNAMPACVGGDKLLAFQRVNTLAAEPCDDICFDVTADHSERALNRLVRGYAAVASSAVTATPDGAAVNLYMPGRYAVPVDDELLILTVSASAKCVQISVHCKEAVKAVVKLRVPSWSRSTEVTVNGADNHSDVKNGMMTFDRTWHDGDTIAMSFELTLNVVDGHHQGKYVMRGPVLMALPVNGENWMQSFVAAAVEDGCITAKLAPVTTWKEKNGIPANIPVLPEADGEASAYVLMPYAKTSSRIALFPGRKQV